MTRIQKVAAANFASNVDRRKWGDMNAFGADPHEKPQTTNWATLLSSLSTPSRAHPVHGLVQAFFR